MTWSNGKGRGAKYGAEHRKQRAAFAAVHDPANPCVRCGRALGPMGPRLHLDHAEDGTYLGFSHASCNVRAGSSKAARITNARRRAARLGSTSLRW